VGDRPDFGIETLFEAVATGRPAAIVEDMCLEAAETIEARLGLATPIDPVR
jgi:hypothetical protein